MDQAPKRALVQPEAGRPIEAPQARPARRADAVIVKRISVDERRVADCAEELRLKRRGRTQTIGADRNPGPLCEWFLADAAIVREKQRKNAVRNPAKETGSSRSR